MYAIVDIAGQQFKVEKGQKIYIHRIEDEEGNQVSFDKVLLIDNEGKVLLGQPYIKGAWVEGKVISHMKGDKVIVFKKKRRKGYQVKNGHRQYLSHVEILSVNETGAPDKAKLKAEKAGAAKPVAKAESTSGETVAKKASKPEVKEPAAKKPAPANTAEKESPSAGKPAAKTAAKATTAKSGAKPAAKSAAKPKTGTAAAAAKPKAATAKPKAAAAKPKTGTAKPKATAAKPKTTAAKPKTQTGKTGSGKKAE